MSQSADPALQEKLTSRASSPRQGWAAAKPELSGSMLQANEPL